MGCNSAEWRGRLVRRAAMRAVVRALCVAGLVAVSPVARASAADGLRVVEVSPQGDVESLEQDVCVVFDRPLRDEGYSKRDRLRLDPPVEGMHARRFEDRICLRGSWLNVATIYRVSLVGEVVAADGSVYTGEPVAWTFTTRRPEVRAYPQSSPVARDEPVELSLTAEVNVAEMRRRVRAYALPLTRQYAFLENYDDDDDDVTEERLAEIRRGRPIAVEVAPRDGVDLDYHVVRGRGGWPAGARIAVVVEAGLRARGGPLGSAKPFILEFETTDVQHIVGESCRDRSACPIGPLEISLWEPPQDLTDHPIIVEPRPDGLDIDTTNDDDGLVIEGAFLAGQTYTVTIPAASGPVVRRYTFTREPSVALSSRAAILDPGLPRTVGVTSRHLERVAVRVARLGDAEASELLVLANRGEALPWPEGLAAAAEREFAVTPTGRNEWADTVIDLQSFVGDTRGALLVEARGRARVGGRTDKLPAPDRALVQVTGLAAIAVDTSYRSILEVVRPGGAALSGVQVGRFGTSDARGIVELTAAKRTGPEVVVLADATTGDRAYMTLPAPPTSEDRMIGSIVATRAMGRPGESIAVLGWTAVQTPRTASGLRRAPAGTWVEVELRRDRQTLVRKRVQTDADGEFIAELEVPRNTARTEHWIAARQAGSRQYFASERLWVASPDLSPHMRAEPVDVAVTTSRAALRVPYVDANGVSWPVSDLDVDLNCREVFFRPPGVEHRWQIGTPEPHYRYTGGELLKIHQQSVDRGGATVFEVEGRYHDWPERCHASVVMSRSSAAETVFMRHPPAYLGISAPADPRAGAAAEVTVRAFNYQGRRTSARNVRVGVGYAAFNDWYSDYDASDSPPDTLCTLDLAASGADGRCSLGTLRPGRYRVIAGDARGGTTVADFYVAGTGLVAGPTKPGPSPPLRVEAGRWIRPGDVRAVHIRAAWDAGPGLLWVEREGLLAARPFTLQKGKAVVRLTAAETWVPEVTIGVAAVRPATTDRPARLEHDTITVKIAGEARRLAVEIEGAPVVGAGTRTAVHVRVRDDRGRAVAGRIDAWMIDEAELALGYYPFDLAAPLPTTSGKVAPVPTLATARSPFVARTLDLVAYPWPEWHGLVGRGGGGGTGWKWRPDRYSRRAFVVGPPPQLGVRLDARGEATLALDLPREPAAMRLFVVATADLADGRGPGRLGKADVTMHVRAATR